MKYEIRIEKAALKQLGKLEKGIRERIRVKIRTLADDPRPYGYKNWLTKAERAASKSAIIEFSMIFSIRF